MNLALLPPLGPDAIEKWLALAAVIASLLLAYRRLFGNGRTVIRLAAAQSPCPTRYAGS